MLKVLRGRLNETENEREVLAIQVTNRKSQQINSATMVPENVVGNMFLREFQVQELPDINLLAIFKDLYNEPSKTRFLRLQQLAFMRNALEEDVLPCLRFGGSSISRSARKIVDSIISDSFIIDTFNSHDKKALLERDEKIAANFDPNLLNRSVFARFTDAVLLESAIQPGCYTCGTLHDYNWRFKITDISFEISQPICEKCYARLESVFQFFSFIRDLRNGVFYDIEGLYQETVRLKQQMFHARIGVLKKVEVRRI